jgi:hypothetical protein
LGETFYRWKSDLNTKYVQKGREPFADYGEITRAQWEEFVRQKTSAEALALSQRNKKLARSNIHKVYLGSAGYQRQLEKWRREREATIAAEEPDPFEGLDERAWMWPQARKPKIVNGKPQFDQPETEDSGSSNGFGKGFAVGAPSDTGFKGRSGRERYCRSMACRKQKGKVKG